MPKRINDEIREKCVGMIRAGATRREIRHALDLHEYQIKYIRQRYAPEVERIGRGREEGEREAETVVEEQEVEFETSTKAPPTPTRIPEEQRHEFQCGACGIIFYQKTKYCAHCGVRFAEY
jgi:hypothetical protein